MRQRSAVFLLAMISSLVWVWAAAAAESQTPNRPKAVAPEPRFEFSTVVEGTEVTHDFVIENHGTAPLNIAKVQTG
ncbi:hypothetical protein D3OALGB2SA_5606 [Olavius algarvensis associated proteobacterium Delta 3]|nr:hypothetical protein D3OALGB2SA_5606 [Olavius algarvensis associated proteobacterium Delta 3]